MIATHTFDLPPDPVTVGRMKVYRDSPHKNISIVVLTGILGVGRGTIQDSITPMITPVICRDSPTKKGALPTN